MEDLKILTQLKAVIQAEVLKLYGKGEPSNRGLEEVRHYSQKLLDGYMKEIMKQSPDLQRKWALGHPFKVVSHYSVQTRNFEIEITTKDDPNAGRETATGQGVE